MVMTSSARSPTRSRWSSRCASVLAIMRPAERVEVAGGERRCAGPRRLAERDQRFGQRAAADHVRDHGVVDRRRPVRGARGTPPRSAVRVRRARTAGTSTRSTEAARVPVDVDQVDPAERGGELILDPALLAELIRLDAPRGARDVGRAHRFGMERVECTDERHARRRRRPDRGAERCLRIDADLDREVDRGRRPRRSPPPAAGGVPSVVDSRPVGA